MVDFTKAQIRRMRAAALRVLRRGGSRLDARGAAIYVITMMEPPDTYGIRVTGATAAAEWASKRIRCRRWVSAGVRNG